MSDPTPEQWAAATAVAGRVWTSAAESRVHPTVRIAHEYSEQVAGPLRARVAELEKQVYLLEAQKQALTAHYGTAAVGEVLGEPPRQCGAVGILHGFDYVCVREAGHAGCHQSDRSKTFLVWNASGGVSYTPQPSERSTR